VYIYVYVINFYRTHIHICILNLNLYIPTYTTVYVYVPELVFSRAIVAMHIYGQLVYMFTFMIRDLELLELLSVSGVSCQQLSNDAILF
jgi:hypothetical protein